LGYLTNKKKPTYNKIDLIRQELKMDKLMTRPKQNLRPRFFYKHYLPHLVLLLVSAVLIFNKLNIPQAIVFDETYHIPSAQKYLNGVFFSGESPSAWQALDRFW
jgi:dolichyl-phosphate-mannose--protein O-mannosyl transferase